MSDKELAYIGVSAQGTKVGFTVERGMSPPRMAIMGTTGCGKSSLMLNSVLMLARSDLLNGKLSVLALDPKASTLMPLAPILSNNTVIYESSEYMGILAKLEKCMLDRIAWLRENGKSRIDPIEDGEQWPMILLLCDELISVCKSPDNPKQVNEAIRRTFVSIFTRARAVNVGWIVASQSFAESETIPTVARSQFHQKAIMKSTPAEVKMLISDPELAPASTLHEPGQFYWCDGDETSIRRCKTWQTSEQEAAEVAARYANRTREIEGLSWNVESPF